MQPQRNSRATRHRVLVVDNDEDTCEAIETILDAIGFSVASVHDTIAARIALDSWRPSIVIFDDATLNLDRDSFVEGTAMRTLRPVLVMLSDSQDAIEAARRAGSMYVLSKPFSSLELVELFAPQTGMLTTLAHESRMVKAAV